MKYGDLLIILEEGHRTFKRGDLVLINQEVNNNETEIEVIKVDNFQLIDMINTDEIEVYHSDYKLLSDTEIMSDRVITYNHIEDTDDLVKISCESDLGSSGGITLMRVEKGYILNGVITNKDGNNYDIMIESSVAY